MSARGRSDGTKSKKRICVHISNDDSFGLCLSLFQLGRPDMRALGIPCFIPDRCDLKAPEKRTSHPDGRPTPKRRRDSPDNHIEAVDSIPDDDTLLG